MCFNSDFFSVFFVFVSTNIMAVIRFSENRSSSFKYFSTKKSFFFRSYFFLYLQHNSELYSLCLALIAYRTMGMKLNQKKRAKYESQKYVEDLDLHVEDPDSVSDEDEDVVHNRRQTLVKSKHASAVLPSDAHCMDGYGDDEYGYAEEHSLAEEASKEIRKVIKEDDFEVPGVSVGITAQKKGKRLLPEVAMEGPVIESIERDFAALSNSERLKILQKESPELLKMLDDLRKYLEEVKSLAKPLHELLHQRKVSSDVDKNLVCFLETKVQLMLNYCIHVTFYLLLKLEGKKISDHPVLDTLVEIRVYLEKIWPLEEKLQYSLNRLLSGKKISAVEVERLRPVQGTDSGFAGGRSRPSSNSEASKRRRDRQAAQEAEELEREELASMTRVRTKKASRLHAIDSSGTSAAPLSYREDEDQYFSKLTRGGVENSEDDDGEENLSLMETLRRRQAALKEHQTRKEMRSAGVEDGLPHGKTTKADKDLYGNEESEEDVESVEEGIEDDLDKEVNDEALSADDEYDQLWREEKERGQKSAASTTQVSRGAFKMEEVDRRKAGKKIEAHRGLTKSRPKDRKNPRVAQRRKYERGMRVHKAQTRPHQPEEEGGFTGVRAIRPGVVRSRTLS